MKPKALWTSDKIRLHMSAWEGRGPVMLLAHGMAGNSHWWDTTAPLLSAGLSPVALDFHGHGDSDWRQDARYDTDVWVSNIETARRTLGGEEFFLCGHSLGARIAMEYAVRHPGRLKGLILVDFLPERSSGSGEREFERARNRKQPLYPDPDTMAKRFRLQPRGTLLDTQQLEALGRLSIRRLGGSYTWNFDWRSFQYEYEPVWPTLARLSAPTLIVRGELSAVFGRQDFERALKATPGARGIEIPRARHHVPLDCPNELAEAVLSFTACPSAAK